MSNEKTIDVRVGDGWTSKPGCWMTFSHGTPSAPSPPPKAR